MKKNLLFLTLILFFISLQMKAADITGALSKVKDVNITYKSVDVNNKQITLSAKLYYKTDDNSKFVVLNCHPTITHNTGCPTGDNPQLAAIKYMASEYAIVICPDYIGFGESSSSIHPYMCATLTARNILDCYKAAIAYYKRNSGKTLVSNYYTINIGYSQGGATALAFQKYMETQATQAEKKLINLHGSVCGAGPYNQNIIFDEYEKMATIDYPVYLYYILRGHKQAFGKTTMRQLELKDCFTTTFWRYCESTLKDLMDNKELTVDEINAKLKSAGYTKFYDIINADYKDRSSKVYRIIRKTLEQSNLLVDDGWMPTAPIVFYHDKAGHDIVVPYAGTEAAMRRFGFGVNSPKNNCSYVDAIDDYDYNTNEDNYLWHPAVFREVWDKAPSSTNLTQKAIIRIATGTDNEAYSFSDLTHRVFGARFYAQFLAARKIMRPNSGGTGDSSNTTISSPTTSNIASTAASVAGQYDVITTAMPYAIPAGQGVFVQFPAKVDGYYFGCDAPRYEVTLNNNGEVSAYTAMKDNADFEPSKVYYIESETAETEPIVSMTAGILTSTVASPLDWRELNIRKLNLLNGKYYATAYMPFAYSSDIAYTCSDDGSEVKAISTEEIAVGTGVVLCDKDNATTILRPNVTNPSGGETATALLGSYSKVSNNGYLTLSAKDNKVGFFKHTGVMTLDPYSCYLTSTAEAKVLVFDASLLGDVDEDGDIDLQDAQALANVLIKVLPETPNADINQDGKITIQDLSLLVDMLLLK